VIVVDKKVLSDFQLPRAVPQDEAWLAEQDGPSVYLTAIGEAELCPGVAIPPAGRRRAMLSVAIDGVLDEDFHGRILPFAAKPPAPMPSSSPSPWRQSPCRPFRLPDCRHRSRHGVSRATPQHWRLEGCGVGLIDPRHMARAR